MVQRTKAENHRLKPSVFKLTITQDIKENTTIMINKLQHRFPNRVQTQIHVGITKVLICNSISVSAELSIGLRLFGLVLAGLGVGF